MNAGDKVSVSDVTGYVEDRVDNNRTTYNSGFVVAAGWSLSLFTVTKIEPITQVYVSVTRTGAAISVGSDGNIPDTDLGTFPAGMHPQYHMECLGCNGISHGQVSVFSTGVTRLRTWTPGGVIATGTVVNFSGTWISQPA